MNKVNLWWGKPRREPSKRNEKLIGIRRGKADKAKTLLRKGKIKKDDLDRWKNWSAKVMKEYAAVYEQTHDEDLINEFREVIDYAKGDYPYREMPKSAVIKGMRWCVRCLAPMTEVVPVFAEDIDKAVSDGYVIPLCDKCHRLFNDSLNFQDAWKAACEEHFIETRGTLDEWTERYGQDYLTLPIQKKRLKQILKEKAKQNTPIST